MVRAYQIGLLLMLLGDVLAHSAGLATGLLAGIKFANPRLEVHWWAIILYGGLSISGGLMVWVMGRVLRGDYRDPT